MGQLRGQGVVDGHDGLAYLAAVSRAQWGITFK